MLNRTVKSSLRPFAPPTMASLPPPLRKFHPRVSPCSISRLVAILNWLEHELVILFSLHEYFSCFVTGDAGDSFSYHNGMKFSTKNSDNDKSSQSCAKLAFGGWWFNNCQQACLTGKYENGTHSAQGIVGIQWSAWKGGNYSLSRVEMKMKPS